MLSCRPAHAARRSDRRPRGNRSSSAPTRRRNARICARVAHRAAGTGLARSGTLAPALVRSVAGRPAPTSRRRMRSTGIDDEGRPTMMTDERTDEEGLRQRAVRQLKKRRDFYGHLLVFVLVNAAAIALWAMGDRGFFWPVFLLFGWGVGLVMNAWDVFYRSYEDETQIQREIERLRQHAG